MYIISGFETFVTHRLGVTPSIGPSLSVTKVETTPQF
jgi:hypothetical protein